MHETLRGEEVFRGQRLASAHEILRGAMRVFPYPVLCHSHTVRHWVFLAHNKDLHGMITRRMV